MFSLYLMSYINSHIKCINKKECVPLYCFELYPTPLSSDMFQLTDDHDQAQNNIL
jgi:hypothetical protein